MAISKERKANLYAQYADWVKESKALVLVEYTGMTMKAFDTLRKEVRSAGGEFHVVKNTLLRRAFAEAGMEVPLDLTTGSSALGVAFEDAPALAKALKDYAGQKGSLLKIKGGFMDGKALSADGVNMLADLPPLPVVRAKLLGVINAPATKLVGVLNEPGASLARVIKAYADKSGAAAA